MKDIQRRKLHINAEPCLHMQFATETDHSPSKKNISIVFLLPTWFARRGITKHLCNPNNYANIIYFINPYHNIACLDMVIRSHNPFLWQPGLISQSTAIVSSGIWTWDLSDSILYLNLKYQCLRNAQPPRLEYFFVCYCETLIHKTCHNIKKFLSLF